MYCLIVESYGIDVLVVCFIGFLYGNFHDRFVKYTTCTIIVHGIVHISECVCVCVCVCVVKYNNSSSNNNNK